MIKKIIIKKIFTLLGILTVLFLIVTPTVGTAPAPAPDPIVMLHRLMEFMRDILILVAVISIIWGAFSFVTASGDDKKLETGRKAILYSVIAVIVATVAHGVIVWVKIFFR